MKPPHASWFTRLRRAAATYRAAKQLYDTGKQIYKTSPAGLMVPARGLQVFGQGVQLYNSGKKLFSDKPSTRPVTPLRVPQVPQAAPIASQRKLLPPLSFGDKVRALKQDSQSTEPSYHDILQQLLRSANQVFSPQRSGPPPGGGRDGG